MTVDTRSSGGPGMNIKAQPAAKRRRGRPHWKPEFGRSATVASPSLPSPNTSSPISPPSDHTVNGQHLQHIQQQSSPTADDTTTLPSSPTRPTKKQRNGKKARRSHSPPHGSNGAVEHALGKINKLAKSPNTNLYKTILQN